MPIDLTEQPEPTLMFRPKDMSDDRLYNPDTDLVWCFGGMTYVALEALQKSRWEPWFGDLLDEKGVPEAELLEGAARFACAIRDMASDPDLKTPGDAFRKHGFFAIRPEVQLVIYARLGQVLSAAYFKGVRLITFPGEELNKRLKLDDLVVAAQQHLVDCHQRIGWVSRLWRRLGGRGGQS